VLYEVHVSRGRGKIELEGNVLKVHTRAEMVANRANVDVIHQISKFFSVDPGRVRILRGSRSRNKIIEITE